MKLDMDLARSILLEIEKHPHGFAPQKIDIPGYSEEQIGYHVHSLGQGGLLEVADVTTHGNGSPSAIPISITWHGHQFLDAARSDSMWKRAGSLITKTGVSMSFDVLKPLLTKLAMDQLGLGGPGPRH